MTDTDKAFTGSIPKLYESHLVPLLFEPYADDLVRRLQANPPARLLEIAAGTGVVTRALSAALPAGTQIVATDLNQAMIDEAAAMGTAHPVEWRQADAMKLPFPDASFDAVVCQFGVMFFPGKPVAFAEARRVLKPGGVFLFNVWHGLEENEFGHVIERAVASVFPKDPPGFLARTPYGYYDQGVIRRDLEAGGFSDHLRFDDVPARSRARSARMAAEGYCQGTPLRNEIEARDPSRLEEATAAATNALAAMYGQGPIEGKIRAYVVRVER